MDEANAEAPGPDLVAIFTTHSRGLAGAVRAVLGGASDVQEVLQDSFLAAWGARARLSTLRDPVAWVFVLTLNRARDLARRKSHRGRVVEADSARLADMNTSRMHTTAQAGPALRLAQAEAHAAARAAIFALSDLEKEVFLLRVSGERSFEGVAEALGIPVGTAKTRMRSALRKLRERLAAHAPDGDDQGTEELR